MSALDEESTSENERSLEWYFFHDLGNQFADIQLNIVRYFELMSNDDALFTEEKRGLLNDIVRSFHALRSCDAFIETYADGHLNKILYQQGISSESGRKQIQLFDECILRGKEVWGRLAKLLTNKEIDVWIVDELMLEIDTILGEMHEIIYPKFSTPEAITRRQGQIQDTLTRS